MIAKKLKAPSEDTDKEKRLPPEDNPRNCQDLKKQNPFYKKTNT